MKDERNNVPSVLDMRESYVNFNLQCHAEDLAKRIYQSMGISLEEAKAKALDHLRQQEFIVERIKQSACLMYPDDWKPIQEEEGESSCPIN